MITHLSIKNYALIEHLEMSPSQGLNVITGETGAGKSIMLGALGLLLGNRADTKALSDSASKCVIEAEFDLKGRDLHQLFEEFDLDYEERSLFRREISPSGKSRAFINDTPVTLEVLKRVGDNLVNIHSQHQTLELGKKDFQLQLVDIFAANQELLTKFGLLYKELKKAEEYYNELIEEQRNNSEQIDYESFLLDELTKAGFQEGEQELLEGELQVLEHAEEIKGLLYNSKLILGESEQAAIVALQEVKSLFSKLSGVSSKYRPLFERLESVFIEIQDIQSEVENEEQAVELNPERTMEVQERLDLLYRLQQKHRVDSIAKLEQIRAELALKVNRSVGMDDLVKEAQHRMEALQLETQELAEEISTKRKRVLQPLKTELELLLSNVGLVDATVLFNALPRILNSYGIDDIELQFSANRGVLPRSLNQMASGGELSRLMFCVKYVLARYMALPTIIFDEIDTGISGEVAIKMGAMMRDMATKHQVVTITHLPQMASFGNTHYYVFKDNDTEKVKSKMKELVAEERKKEIAKMIGGDSPSQAAIESARELLVNSGVVL